MLTNTREELKGESKSVILKKQLICYTTNIQVAGNVTNALIDAGAEITCVSEEFLNANKERFERYPSLPLAGVAVTGPMGGGGAVTTKRSRTICFFNNTETVTYVHHWDRCTQCARN